MRKRVGRHIEETLSKGKRNAWRILLVVIGVISLIIIGRPLISLIARSVEIYKLNREKAAYTESIRRDSILIENLKNDEFLEKYAREKFLMKGKNEDVFIVE